MSENNEALGKIVGDWTKAVELLNTELYREQGVDVTAQDLRKFLGIFLYMVAGTVGAEHAISYMDSISSKNPPRVLDEINGYYQQAKIIADRNMDKKVPFDITLKEFSEYFLNNNNLVNDLITKGKLHNLFLAIYEALMTDNSLTENFTDLESEGQDYLEEESEAGSSTSQSSYNNSFEETGSNDVNSRDLSCLEEEYGKLLPLVLDEKTRIEGYSKIEELFNDGFSEAGVILGQRYAAVDREKSKKFFEFPAKENNSEALWGLANCMPHNFVPQENNKDDEAWINMVLKAAELGCPDAMNEAGNIENRRNNYYMSAYWYGIAELYEHPQAIHGCKGIAKRWVEAGKPEIPDEFKNDILYQQASYMIKTDTDDRTTAFSNIISAAQTKGYSTLALFAAKIFESQENNDLACRMYQKAAAEGDLQATRALADMLMTGTGCTQDSGRALAFYEQAAIRGNSISCFVMGEFERNQGNTAIANAWYGKALVRGYNPAANRIQNINGKVDKTSSTMVEAEKLYYEAEQYRKEKRTTEARKIYQESYELGWAPSKRGLWLTDPKRIESYEKAAKLAKEGIRINLSGDSDPIDAEFYTKIKDFIIYLAKNNNARDVFIYLDELLFDRHDLQSLKYVFEAYKNSLIYIDKTTYDENSEIRLLDTFIRRGGIPEAETLKNTRYKKVIFSGKWVKRKT